MSAKSADVCRFSFGRIIKSTVARLILPPEAVVVDEQIDVFNRESGGTITLPIVSILAIESGFIPALDPCALLDGVFGTERLRWCSLLTRNQHRFTRTG